MFGNKSVLLYTSTSESNYKWKYHGRYKKLRDAIQSFKQLRNSWNKQHGFPKMRSTAKIVNNGGVSFISI